MMEIVDSVSYFGFNGYDTQQSSLSTSINHRSSPSTMSQSPITKFFRPTKSDSVSTQSKHRDSPRPATSADNLVRHTLKRLRLYPESDSHVQMSPTKDHDDLLHKVPSPRRDRPTTYTFGEKMDALEQAFLHGFSVTSRKLNIPCSTLSTWKKDLVEAQGALSIRSPLKGKRRGPSARKLTYSGHTDELATWLSELRFNKKSVTYEQMKTKIRSKMGEDAFQAKSGWLAEFMAKHSVTVDPQTRRVITDTDKMLRDCSGMTSAAASGDLDTSMWRVKQEPSDDVDLISRNVQKTEFDAPEYNSCRTLFH